MTNWTVDQIISLAPDASSAKSGKELASARKWVSLGCDDKSIWGECQGSAKAPYQTQIDLSGPAFRCSCPSRKFPCKHGLGLFLLYASQVKSFTQNTAPAWAQEWLDKRAQQSEKTSTAVKEKAEKSPNLAAQARRAAQREDRVRQGLQDLELWLYDLARQGWNTAPVQNSSFWETPAARLVDAQAPGLARRMRDMASIPVSGEGWQERLLAKVSSLYLLVRGFQQLEHLSPENQEDIRSLIGWTVNQDELLSQPGIHDQWLVLGSHTEEDAIAGTRVLKTQRTWLWGTTCHRSALILSFAAPGQTLDVSLVPGIQMDAELVYFPGTQPQRALVKTRAAQQNFLSQFPDLPAETFFENYAAALTLNPWLSLYPMPLHHVLPHLHNGKMVLSLEHGTVIPLPAAYPDFWTLVSLSGGDRLDVFGEWDGHSFLPLSVWHDQRFISMQPKGQEE